MYKIKKESDFSFKFSVFINYYQDFILYKKHDFDIEN